MHVHLESLHFLDHYHHSLKNLILFFLFNLGCQNVHGEKEDKHDGWECLLHSQIAEIWLLDLIFPVNTVFSFPQVSFRSSVKGDNYHIYLLGYCVDQEAH